jgi:hypothetical protein
VATGQIVSRLHFENTVAGYVREQDPAGDLGEELAPKEGDLVPLNAGDYVHLFSDAKCLVGQRVVRHEALRLRLDDVTAWTVGRLQPA